MWGHMVEPSLIVSEGAGLAILFPVLGLSSSWSMFTPQATYAQPEWIDIKHG